MKRSNAVANQERLDPMLTIFGASAKPFTPAHSIHGVLTTAWGRLSCAHVAAFTTKVAPLIELEASSVVAHRSTNIPRPALTEVIVGGVVEAPSTPGLRARGSSLAREEVREQTAQLDGGSLIISHGTLSVGARSPGASLFGINMCRVQLLAWLKAAVGCYCC